jgi:hypothetical protein
MTTTTQFINVSASEKAMEKIAMEAARAYSALCDLLRVDFSMAFRAELDEKTD